jgi:L-serine dehydratase
MRLHRFESPESASAGDGSRVPERAEPARGWPKGLDSGHGLPPRHHRSRDGRALVLAHGGGLPPGPARARSRGRHATDKAIAGGLLGFRPDDERIRTALEIAEREGLDYRFEKTTIEGDAHPNTARITVERGERRAVMVGSSLGAGRVLVSEIDGFPVEVTGSYHTIVLVAEDVKGSVARIAAILADHDLNIATLRLSRKQKGGDAFMVIELDDPPADRVRDDIVALSWVRWAFRLEKVGA